MTDQRFLIKCDCEECNCENATPDGVCYECEKGLHVRDREREILGDVSKDEVEKFIEQVGLTEEQFRSIRKDI